MTETARMYGGSLYDLAAEEGLDERILGELDGLGHAGRGELQNAGERRRELVEAGVARSEHHRRRTTHRQAHDAAHLGRAPVLLQDRWQFLHQEGLPHVVLAAVGLLPVGVEARLTTDGQDDVDVLVLVEVDHVGVEDPAALVVLGAQAVEHGQLREPGVRLGIPVAGEQQLHLDIGLHRGRVHPDRHPATAVPVDVGDLDAVVGGCRRGGHLRRLGGRFADCLGRRFRCGPGRGHLGRCGCCRRRVRGYRPGHETQCDSTRTDRGSRGDPRTSRSPAGATPRRPVTDAVITAGTATAVGTARRLPHR